MLHMSRREFITLLGGEAAAWPLAAKAQQSEQMRRIGVLMSYLESDGEAQEQTKAFSQSLKEFGWTDGVRWSRLSEQFFRVDKWSVCRG